MHQRFAARDADRRAVEAVADLGPFDDVEAEHEVRALTSTDGATWVAGGVWTFPPGTDLRVGLVAHGWDGAAPRATARFDHLRVWAD